VSAVQIVTALYDYGLRFNPQPYMPKRGYYALELSEKRPILSYQEGVIEAPDCPKHTSGNAPWYGYDQATYALALDPKRGEAFYARLEAILREVSFEEPLSSIPRVLKHLLSVVSETNNVGVTTLTGLDVDPSIEVSAKKPLKVSKRAIVVITWKGEPIIHHAGVRAKFNPFVVDGTPPTHTDVVTGKPCVPKSKHDQIKGVPGTQGWAPLFSAKFSAYGYQRPMRCISQESGDNFAVSSQTSRTYALGLSKAKKILINLDNQDLSLVLWPSAATDHPIIDLAKAFFLPDFKSDIDAYWEAVHAPLADPDSVISVLMLRGSKGRISCLNWAQIPAASIQAALLRVYNAFHVSGKCTFYSTCLRVDEKSSSVISPICSQVVWALITGTDFPPVLRTYLAALFVSRPIGVSEEDYRKLLRKNIRGVASWTALLDKGQQRMDTDLTEDDINKWGWNPDDHPKKFGVNPDDSNLLYVYGLAIGLAEFLPVYYHDQGNSRVPAISKRGEEFPMATANPKSWIGTTVSRFHPYCRRFEVNRTRGGHVWALFREAVNKSREVLLSGRPISPDRQGDVAIGFYAAEAWASKFYWSPKSTSVPAE